MPNKTSKYQLGYFTKGELTLAETEAQRWETLDAQLYALFNIIGNGVLNGWTLVKGAGLSITVTPGSGHVSFVAVESTENVTILNLTPNTVNYIYAQLTPTSYWTKSVTFAAYVNPNEDEKSLLLGTVKTTSVGIADDILATETTPLIPAIDTSDKKELGFVGLIKSAVADHRHIGGTDNPPPIDLGSEVQGVIGQENLPEMDASIIKTGKIDVSRIPKLSHITALSDQGTLTHAQIESILDSISISNQGLMGEIAVINLLQLVLALKHIYPNIDDYLVNEISIIPGITPDNYIDFVNTTATVDTRTYEEGGQHTITGTPALPQRFYTKTWDSEEDYEGSTKSNVFIDGNFVTLNSTEDLYVIDDFSSINNWTVVTEDVSSTKSNLQGDNSNYVLPSQSGMISINGKEVEMVLLIKKTFSPKDWSDFNYLKFYIKTDSVQHGDLYVYFSDGVAGVQNSYTKVLSRNKPTINENTMQNGWQEVVVDISMFERSSVNLVSFMMSTQDGWDSSKSFKLNIDDMHLSSGNVYEENGYLRIRYGNDIPYLFSATRWDATLPSNSLIKSRARFANTLLALDSASWTDYSTISGQSFGLASDQMYKFAEIELFIEPSTDRIYAPYVSKIYLDFYASDVTNNVNITSQEDWEAGSLFNVDTKSSPGDIKTSGLGDIGTTFFGGEGKIGQMDSDFNVISYILGSALPQTTNQASTYSQSQFGLITGLDRGSNGNIWLSDVDNDRVVEIDSTGHLVRAFYGSFISEPLNQYGIEDGGVGSNVYTGNFVSEFGSKTTPTEGSTGSSTGNAMAYNLSVLHSIYNPDKGVLYIVFNKKLENIYAMGSSLDLNKIKLKVGSHMFFLNNSNAKLFNVDEEKYLTWVTAYESLAPTTTTATPAASSESLLKHLRQFGFTSHVLELEIPPSEKTALNSMVRKNLPRVAIVSPSNNETTGKDLTAKFMYYDFDIGQGVGEPSARVTLDGNQQIIYASSVDFSNLAQGEHSLKVELLDENGTLYPNIGSYAETKFIIPPSNYINPILSVISPKPNQVFSTPTVYVNVNCKNFPIIPSGQHVVYQIDNGTKTSHFSNETIVLKNIKSGKHTIKIYLADEFSDDLEYEYGTVEVDFIVGLNPDATAKLHLQQGTIKSLDSLSSNPPTTLDVDVANVILSNIYAPIDIQVVPFETSKNADSVPTVVVGKLRSPSSTKYLSGIENATEIAARIVNLTATPENKVRLNDSLASIKDDMLIYGEKYMDGHSVVQIDGNGNVVFSNNAAVFADTKSQAKEILGGVKKIGFNEVIIADAVNKRAIITNTDLSSQNSQIIWQFDSDKYITDFAMVPQQDVVVTVNNGSIDEPYVIIKQGTTITWLNNSASPITVYSGSVTQEIFDLDPDLNKYGDMFKSDVLNPGERYTYRFNEEGDFYWFVYPSILTGKVTVSKQRISPRDQFYVMESDGLESPYTSRAIKIDTWGNVLWSFGEGYLIQPRDIRPMLNNKVLIST